MGSGRVTRADGRGLVGVDGATWKHCGTPLSGSNDSMAHPDSRRRVASTIGQLRETHNGSSVLCASSVAIQGGLNHMAAEQICALADDLTGAIETASLLSVGTGDAEVVLADHPPRGEAEQPLARNAQTGSARVVDLDVRHASGAAAYAAVLRASETAGRVDFVKIDSLLRGNPASLIAAATATGPVVVCPALPAAARTTKSGRLRSPDLPAYDGRDLAALLPPAGVALIGLRVVRGDPCGLGEAIAGGCRAGRVPVCDAETAADLDRIVAAATALGGVTLVGSGGLAAAAGRARSRTRARCGDAARPSGTRRVLAVIGSAESSAHAQVDRLEACGGQVITARDDVGDDAGAYDRLVEAVRDALGRGPVVLTAGRGSKHRGGESATIARCLGDVVRDALGGACDTRLFLTGGQTARAVFDALGVRVARVVAEVDMGAVYCRTDTGHEVVTRPGSMGGPDALLKVVEYLKGAA
ncbi:MAG: four-carbon acid sugar kinase family protein [Nocardioidaceae bacterium]